MALRIVKLSSHPRIVLVGACRYACWYRGQMVDQSASLNALCRRVDIKYSETKFRCFGFDAKEASKKVGKRYKLYSGE